MLSESKIGVEPSRRWPSPTHPEGLAAGTVCETTRVEMRLAAGFVLENCGIPIADARTGVMEAGHSH